MKPLHHSFFSLLICCLSVPLSGQAQVGLVDSTGASAVIFSGTQPSMTIQDAASLETGQGDEYTIELWARPTQASQNSFLLHKPNTYGPVPQMSLRLINGELAFQRGIQIMNSGSVLSTVEWSHIAVVVSTSGWTIYVNGLKRTSGGFSASVTASSSELSVGSKLGAFPFIGQLDEFRFWSTALGKTDVNKTKHHNLTTSPSDLECNLQFNQVEDGSLYGGGPGSFAIVDPISTHHLISPVTPTLELNGCPVAVGERTFQQSTSTTLTFPEVSYSGSLTGSGEYQLVFSRMSSAPNTWTGIDHTDRIMDGRHWYISWYGAVGRSGTHTFYSDEPFPAEFAGQPQQFHLYWRAENSTGSWSDLTTAQSVDMGARSVTFDCTLLQGQYCVIVGEPNYPTTGLEPGSCGATDVDIRQKLYATSLTDVDEYQFVVENLAMGFSDTVNSAGRVLKLKYLSQSVSYSTTYDVKVRGKWGNDYGSFGETCEITVEDIPATQLKPENCGITATIVQGLYATAVAGAAEYIFEIDGISEPYSTVYVNTSPKVKFSWLPPGISYDNDYEIKVRSVVGEDTSDYGSTCTVSTQSWPTTGLTTEHCGTTEHHTAWWLQANGVSLVEEYQFEVSDTAADYLETYVSTVKKFKLKFLSGTSNSGQTYQVRVRTISGTDTSAFGPYCDVSMQTLLSRIGQFSEDGNLQEESEIDHPEVTVIQNVFPNPFTSSVTLSFTLGVDQTAEIQVYDSMGRLVKDFGQTRLGTGDHNFIWDGTNNRGNTVQPGTYIMVLRNDLDFIVRSERVVFKR